MWQREGGRRDVPGAGALLPSPSNPALCPPSCAPSPVVAYEEGEGWGGLSLGGGGRGGGGGPLRGARSDGQRGRGAHVRPLAAAQEEPFKAAACARGVSVACGRSDVPRAAECEGGPRAPPPTPKKGWQGCASVSRVEGGGGGGGGGAELIHQVEQHLTNEVAHKHLLTLRVGDVRSVGGTRDAAQVADTQRVELCSDVRDRVRCEALQQARIQLVALCDQVRQGACGEGVGRHSCANVRPKVPSGDNLWSQKTLRTCTACASLHACRGQ